MSDQCLQYKKDYENLLELKQQFDAALVEGEKTRDFTEAKRMKAELEKAIIYLERFRITIELGTGLKTAADFSRALKEEGCDISKEAKFMLRQSKFTVLSEKTEFKLTILSVAELGLPDGATTEEIFKRAKEMGLELCPPEVGPQLRLQDKNQPQGEWLHIAMETIKDSTGLPHVFGVTRAVDEPWLQASLAFPDINWSAHFRWVFVRRKLT